MRHAVERDHAGFADRRSAGSDGRSCSCRRPRDPRSQPSRPAAPGTTRRRARRVRPRRIGEANILERDLSARRLRQRDRPRRRHDRRPHVRGSRTAARPRPRPAKSRPRPRSVRRARRPRTPHKARTGTAARRSSGPTSTSCAPTHSTITTLAKTRKMAIAVSTARDGSTPAPPERPLDRGAETVRWPAPRW